MIRFIVRLYHPNGGAVGTTERECINPGVLQSKIEQARIDQLEAQAERVGISSAQEMMDLGYSTRIFIEIDDVFQDNIFITIKDKHDQMQAMQNSPAEESNGSNS